ncbi:MAG: protein kinase [Vicinamibacteria bacterium]|nr:protein kinase [Vicinamibacteria bacterium]
MSSASISALAKYRILERIGAGAMGEVFKARDEGLDRVVALKTILERAGDDAPEERRERFRREAQAAAGLTHPNIVTIYDFGEADGRCYLAMELLEGEDLSDALRRGPLGPLPARLALLAQAGAAVGFAHAKGVVHRDLKPANIRLLPGGGLKILDFGLARIEGSDATRSGQVLGTPHYMSPEQVRGERADARSDVFALGAIGYEVLSGRKPFPAPSVHAALFQVLEREPEPVHELNPEVPPIVDRVLRRALAKQASERFRDGQALAEAFAALHALVEGRATAAEVEARLEAPAGASAAGGQAAGAWLRASASMSRAGASVSAVDTAPVAAAASGVQTARVVYQAEGGADKSLTVATGRTLLEAALQEGIPHFHECGGRARCSTCRVRVAQGTLAPRSADEARLATRLGWGDDIRLACQAKVTGPVSVRRLVLDEEDLGLLVSERRAPAPTREMAVAVMSAGLLDMASRLRKLPPYDVVHVLNRFFSFVADPAVTGGGTIQGYTGDGFNALFGLDGGDAKAKCVTAVRAALRMQARMDDFNKWLKEHFKLELELGVGLHFGRMVVGRVGHPSKMETTAVGGAAAAAERLRVLNRGRGTRILATEELVNVIESEVRLGVVVQEDDTLDGRHTTIHEIVDFEKRDAVMIVQDTFEQVARRKDEAAALFYELLFQVDPSARPLFRVNDMKTQGDMLMSVLATAVRGLDRIDELKPVLRELGRRHEGYGVELRHYDSVEQALLEMVRRITGQEFSADVRLAWARIYSELTAVMLEGAAA